MPSCMCSTTMASPSDSESVGPSHQTISECIQRQWFSNTQQSRFLTACQCLEKL